MTNVFTSQTGAAPRLQAELFRPSLQYPTYPYAEMLTQTAARYPEHVALVFNDVNLTYRELEALVNACARGLLALSISRGQTVCLLMTNRPEYVISWFAITRIGAVASPMNPSYKEREIAYQLSNSEAVAVIVQNNLVPLIQGVRTELPALQRIFVVDVSRPTARGGPTFLSDANIHTFGQLVRSYPSNPPIGVEIQQ